MKSHQLQVVLDTPQAGWSKQNETAIALAIDITIAIAIAIAIAGAIAGAIMRYVY